MFCSAVGDVRPVIVRKRGRPSRHHRDDTETSTVSTSAPEQSEFRFVTCLL